MAAREQCVQIRQETDSVIFTVVLKDDLSSHKHTFIHHLMAVLNFVTVLLREFYTQRNNSALSQVCHPPRAREKTGAFGYR